ncbi:hypothetical protein [Amycolatopsis sp. NPDC059657]|uniref:hypothetical protein n=1 Tax=Amycolatopsis sp. NPDC059657 TaxID=3346899 RepID=UPI003671FEAC
MNRQQKELVALLRVVEWQVSEVAFATMKGTCSPQKYAELAKLFEVVVALLRLELPVVIDAHDRT